MDHHAAVGVIRPVHIAGVNNRNAGQAGGGDQLHAGLDGRLQACGRQADFIDRTIVMTETILHVDDHQGGVLCHQLHRQPLSGLVYLPSSAG